MQRFLDPVVLATISSLELIARTVIDGFVAGLHRSPDFGFSQEFAEYRPYTQGDDLRHVDWNLFARTERCYLKRYEGETNSHLTILLDASNSMHYGFRAPTKADYARYLAASLFYLAIHNQRDAAGIIVFDDDVRDYVPPSTRTGQFYRLLAALERAEPRARTDIFKPLTQLHALLHRRGIIGVISDFYEDPVAVINALEQFRFKGNDVILFHILDPHELQPVLNCPSILRDIETREEIEVIPQFVDTTYKSRIQTHIEQLRARSLSAGMEYRLITTNQPLDQALREYLSLRKAGV